MKRLIGCWTRQRRHAPNEKSLKSILGVVLLLLAATPTFACGHHYHRSWAAKHAFEVATGHPHGWPGHVVDHVVPLACGGADSPSNMQWQTVAEGKAKDRVELRNCNR